MRAGPNNKWTKRFWERVRTDNLEPTSYSQIHICREDAVCEGKNANDTCVFCVSISVWDTRSDEEVMALFKGH